MTVQIFGHKSPDTDSTGAPILWSWYLNTVKNITAIPRLLGTPNTEAAFVLNHWNLEQPELLGPLAENDPVIIVDTNNPDELPKNINTADIRAIIDHHKLVGGLETKAPIDITVRPLACTATIMLDLMGTAAAAQMPKDIKGVALSCILSDTLEFRSPTTTDHDREVAEKLAADLGVSIPAYAAKMFAAKSDVSAFSDAALLRMDSKEFTIGEMKLRVSVLETTSPDTVLARKNSLMQTMPVVAAEDGAAHVLLFVVDILNTQATLLVQNAAVKSIAEASFGVTVDGDTVILPGVVSRKKQIIPQLKT